MIGALIYTSIRTIVNFFKKQKDYCEHKYKITKIEITKNKNTIQSQECEKCGKKEAQFS